jgi:glycosyltransferase involved in cell wall biosynthesis
MAVESLFNQSYPKDRYEIIIVDDASTDGIENMVGTLQTLSPCTLRYIRNKKNSGSAVSRQKGLENARGEIIASMDSDCIACPNWLSAGVKSFRDGIGLVQGKVLPGPNPPRKFWSRTIRIYKENFAYITCNMFYIKDALLSAGGFRVELCDFKNLTGCNLQSEDIDAAWRMKQEGWESTYSEDAIVWHQVFEQSMLQWLLEPTVYFLIPYFVKKYPGIRTFLYRRIFFFKHTALFDLTLIGLLGGIFLHPILVLTMIPYSYLHLKSIFKNRPFRRYPHGFVKFCLRICYDLILFVTLIYGSVKYRALVL